MSPFPTPGSSILIKTSKELFLCGFTGGGKFMAQLMRSFKKKYKKPYGISLP